MVRFLFMRHGEAEHNVAYRSVGDAAFCDPAFKDARLTDEGCNQCNETGESQSAVFKQFDAIYTSPLTRCIQTAVLMKQWIPSENFNANDALIERRGGGHICNVRRERDAIKAEFAEHGLNCDLLAETDEDWSDREPLQFVESRIVMFLRDLLTLYADSEASILVVTHHDVLYVLLGGVNIKNADTIVLDEDELRELLY
jgi:broad specificity phosphatase PhoE